MRTLLLCVFASRLAAQDGMGCVKEIMVPRYDNQARFSPGGTVRAVVKIGSDGRANGIETFTNDSNLAEAVRGYLTLETKYDTTCRGKRVTMVFTFRLEGEPEHTPPVWIKFQPPNHFIIISRPQKMILDTFR